MGKLRLEPREKQMSPEEYQRTKSILDEARSAVAESRVYYDLDEGENARKVRKTFQNVAEKEGIGLRIRRQRGTNTLELIFDSAAGDSREAPKRLTAEEGRQRILEVLSAASEPMRRSEVVEKAGISTGTWSLRIKELMKQGKVVKHGSMRDSAYSLP